MKTGRKSGEDQNGPKTVPAERVWCACTGLDKLVGPVQEISVNFRNNKELGVVCFPATANAKQNNTHEKNLGPNVAKPESVRGKCKSARSILELENDPCG